MTVVRNGVLSSRCRPRRGSPAWNRRTPPCRSVTSEISSSTNPPPTAAPWITPANGGSVKPGVWFYNGAAGERWPPNAAQPMAALPGPVPDEFWTVSDGRAGQAQGSTTEIPPVAQQHALSLRSWPERGHVEIVASYAHPHPFRATPTRKCTPPRAASIRTSTAGWAVRHSLRRRSGLSCCTGTAPPLSPNPTCRKVTPCGTCARSKAVCCESYEAAQQRSRRQQEYLLRPPPLRARNPEACRGTRRKPRLNRYHRRSSCCIRKKSSRWRSTTCI